MFESLFGSEMPLAARFFIAFLVVLALIGVTAWLVRRFGATRLGSTARGRQPRLAVIDAATVDGRRRLVLIRRDNVEHLLMIGGPTDLVVEPNIVRAVAAREVAREPARAGTPAETAVRPSHTAENGWPLQPAGEPAPAHTPRPCRPAAVRRAVDGARADRAAATGRRRRDCRTNCRTASTTRIPPPVVGDEPPPRSPAPVSEPASAHADHNLAEMAQQLEAALRRSPAPEGRPPATDPLAGQFPPEHLAKVAIRAHARLRDPRTRVEPKFEPKAEPKFEPRSEPKFEAKPEPREPASTPGKNLYENLEEEMASLLGRPPGKS